MNVFQCCVSTKLCLVLTALTSISCVSKEERLAKLPSPRIERLTPSTTPVGHDFQVQPSGLSAFSIHGSHFLPGCRIHFKDTPLTTTFNGPTNLTGLLPRRFYMSEGRVSVLVANPDGQISNAAIFTVTPAPRLDRLYPDHIEAGQSFNLQKTGESALAIHGANFSPGAVIFMDGIPLKTAFGNPEFISALVPQDLLRQARVARITVKNPDGSISAVAKFAIE